MRKLLLVDDDPFSLAVLERRLTLDGFDVLAVSDPFQAFSHLHRGRFDGVISDLEMPSVSGLSVLDAARRAQPHAVRILMSASLREIRVPPSTHCLSKPIAYSVLLAVLIRAGHSLRPPRPSVRPPTLRPGPSTRPAPRLSVRPSHSIPPGARRQRES